jgi:ankyrin repeat protein
MGEIVQLLLAHKDIQVHAKDNYGRTALSHMVWSGDVSMITELLLAHNVDINSKDKGGRTPLWYAVIYGSPEIVELLLSQQGIDIDTRDKFGRTPLSEAAAHGRLEALELLLAHGAAADLKDCFGLTPRMRAWWSSTEDREAILQTLKASDWKYVSK